MRMYGSVDAPALISNLSLVRRLSPTARVMAVVKANGYGHGILQVANSLDAGVDAFAVATVDEAVALRDASIKKPICLLSGFTSIDHVAILHAFRIEPVIYCEEQIDMLERAQPSGAIPVWVKINTGMNRLGFESRRTSKIFQNIDSSPILEVRGVMSHFACADDLESDFTDRQLERFKSCTQGIDADLSIANSAGILKWPNSCLNWVRPGIMLYGVSPFPGIAANELGLQPAMNLYSTIIAVNRHPSGSSVGYGLKWSSEAEIRVGIVACGYGDGYSRNASPGAQVLIEGRRADVIGVVSMDTLAVDLSQHPHVGVGSSVKLFGEGLPVEEVAAAAGTIPYETLASINSRSVKLEYT